MRQARLQFAAQPAMLAPALELADGSAAAYAALADVLIALRGTDTWQRFSAADAGLEPTDREAAKAIRYAYRQAVDSVRVDDIAGETVLRDGMFRRAELARVKGQASGRFVSISTRLTLLTISLTLWPRSYRTGLPPGRSTRSYTQKLWMRVKRKAAYLPG